MIKEERIRDAAFQLFTEKGYKAMRMEDLAEYLGISKKTLYNHFDSKDSLIVFALQHKVDEILNLLENLIENREKDFITRLEDVLSTASTALAFSEDFNSEKGLPKDLINQTFPKFHDHIMRLIQKHVDEGLNEGYIREDVPVETLPYVTMGIIESFLKMESRYNVKSSVTDMLNFIRTIIFTGLLTDKGRKILEDSK